MYTCIAKVRYLAKNAVWWPQSGFEIAASYYSMTGGYMKFFSPSAPDPVTNATPNRCCQICFPTMKLGTLCTLMLLTGLKETCLVWVHFFFCINNLLFSSSMVWYGVHINYLMSGRVSSRVGHWVNRPAVKTLLPTSLGLPIQKKLFLTKKFRSKNFACLWKPVVLQLKTLMKPLMSRVFGDIRKKVLCIYILVTSCWL